MRSSVLALLMLVPACGKDVSWENSAVWVLDHHVYVQEFGVTRGRRGGVTEDRFAELDPNTGAQVRYVIANVHHGGCTVSGTTHLWCLASGAKVDLIDLATLKVTHDQGDFKKGCRDAGTVVQFYSAKTLDGTLTVACETGKLYGIDTHGTRVAAAAEATAPVRVPPVGEPEAPYSIYIDTIFKDGKPTSKHYSPGRFVRENGAYVMIDGDYVAAFGDPKFKATKKQIARVSLDGTERWVTTLDLAASESPEVHDAGDLLLVVAKTKIIAIDKRTGTVRWTHVPDPYEMS